MHTRRTAQWTGAVAFWKRQGRRLSRDL